MGFLQRITSALRRPQRETAALMGADFGPWPEPTLADYVHYDVAIVMEATIIGIYPHLAPYQESFIPLEPQTGRKGLGLLRYDAWDPILERIVGALNRKTSDRPELTKAYRQLVVLATDAQSTAPAELKATRVLLANRILAAVPKAVG